MILLGIPWGGQSIRRVCCEKQLKHHLGTICSRKVPANAYYFLLTHTIVMMFQKDSWICPSNHHTYAYIYILYILTYILNYILTDFRQNHQKPCPFLVKNTSPKNWFIHQSFLGIKPEDVTSPNSPAFCCISTKRSMWFESRATSTALRPWLFVW